ncbi:MAG: PEP-CTERM sorting domain-containing protein [Candidatus Pacearchaeota archaeon]|jgi:hypothetical protein
MKTRSKRSLASILGAGLLVVMPMSEAKGELITLNSTFGNGINTSNVQVGHNDGATEGFDEDFDFKYNFLESPAIDFYSIIGDEKLLIDTRGLDSFSVFNTYMMGNGLTNSEEGRLDFSIADDTSLNNRKYFADIFKGDNKILSGIDILDYDARNEFIPLNLSNGESYRIDVYSQAVPEPSSLVLMAGLGLMGAGAYLSRRKKE